MTCFSLTVLFFEKKSRQKKLQLSGTIYRFFRLPCVKGAVGASRLRDCFYNPSTTSWSPSPYTGEAKSELLSATPARALRALANQTPLGEACKHASHTCKSLTQGRLIQPSPVGEGGSRRLTDEVFFCKRNFNNCFVQTL